MEQKKETNAQLQRKIKNALVFVPKDKEYIGMFFSDKGLRLETTSDAAVISTGFHRHVFSSITNTGLSRPFLYTKRVIEIANENDCKTDDGYSFRKLIEILKEKEDRTEYNICIFYEWWCQVIFDGLYSIGESEVESFLVYLKYMNLIAINSILLSEKTEDMTNKQFVEKFVSLISEFTEGMEEQVVFKKKHDEDVIAEDIKAMQEEDIENTMNI